MINQLISFALDYVIIMSIVLFIFYTFAAILYDISETKIMRLLDKQNATKSARSKTLLTVLIYANNSAVSIEACLSSLVNNSYHNIEIIVIDCASNDQTRSITRNFIRAHPKAPIKLLAKRVKATLPECFSNGYKKFGHGKMILAMTADTMVETDSFDRAIRYFEQKPAINILKPNIIMNANQAIGSLFQLYYVLFYQSSYKCASFSNTAPRVDAAAFYDETTFTKLFKNETAESDFRSVNVRFASHVRLYAKSRLSVTGFVRWCFAQRIKSVQAVVSTIPLLKSSKSSSITIIKWARLLCSLSLGVFEIVFPILLGYFIYLAVSLHEPLYLMVCMSFYSLILINAIWDQSGMNVIHKMNLTLALPLTYGISIIVACMQPFVYLRLLIPIKLRTISQKSY